jgi:hypothetical protein
MSGRTRRIVYGALGGAIGAACMTVVRLAARRRGLVDKTVSQAAEEWLASRTKIAAPRDPAMHHLLDQTLHAGYGASWGALYGLAASHPGRHRSGGLGFGIITWLAGSWLLMPMLGAKRPPWRNGVRENGVDLVAHLLYGLTVALVSAEMTAQTNHHTSSDARRWLARVG